MLRVKDLKGAIALDMPYKGERLSMIFLLPDPNHSSLEDLEEAMSKVTDLNSILKFGKKVKVQVTLPRFKLESQLELVEPLKQLGMTDMFDETKADFSGKIWSFGLLKYLAEAFEIQWRSLKILYLISSGSWKFINVKIWNVPYTIVFVWITQ